jgi:hypothetical protein
MARLGRIAVVLAAFCAGLSTEAAVAQAPDPVADINWEVVNRFRLLTDRRDFERLEQEHNDARVPGSPPSVAATELRAAESTQGEGWATRVLDRTCLDRLSGRVLRNECWRDGKNENYYNPADHLVRLTAPSAALVPNATCIWKLDPTSSEAPQPRPCAEAVERRFPLGQATQVHLTVRVADGRAATAEASILVRDILIVGMGDSIGSGEGNPERTVKLANRAMCYERVGGGPGTEFHRPRRAVGNFDSSCAVDLDEPELRRQWETARAQWLYAACHRSLYGYQVRAALALAIENKQVAVTYIPLGCSGATIRAGLIGAQPARERLWLGNTGRRTPPTVESQFSQLANRIGAPGARSVVRRPDLILLTVGANDIRFAEIVANVMLEEGRERQAFASFGLIKTVRDAAILLNGQLRQDFGALRRELSRFVGPSLSRVVFVSYPNPALGPNGAACEGGRHGVDIHPAFNVDRARVAEAVAFVNRTMLPRLRAYATCGSNGGCANPGQAMTFVDQHQAAFAGRGFCARGASDPEFDRLCFSRTGESFRTPDQDQRPLECRRHPNQFRAYAARERWIRTPNDSYFAAMTFPSLRTNPANLNDAVWGLAASAYGGAIHPTAQGHAVIADAALPDMRRVLGLPEPPIFVTRTP